MRRLGSVHDLAVLRNTVVRICDDLVASSAADDPIGAGAADDPIVPRPPADAIVPAASVDRIRRRRADEDVRSRASDDRACRGRKRHRDSGREDGYADRSSPHVLMLRHGAGHSKRTR